MHQDNLRFLYREYRNCLKNEFSNYFSKDDEYKSYHGRCFQQQSDLRKYYASKYNKFLDTLYLREHEEIFNKYEINYTKFGKHGWNAAQIKNYFLNIDRTKEEHDVWANHVMAAHNSEDWGLYKSSQPDNKKFTESRMKSYETDPNPAFIKSNKWTGKPSDDWNRVDQFVHPKVVA